MMKTRVMWTEEEVKSLGQSAYEVWLNNMTQSQVWCIAKAVHTTMSQDRWRIITSDKHAPEVFSTFQSLLFKAREALVNQATPEVMYIHTKEDVMLPPEQTIKFIPTPLLIGELGIRLSSVISTIDALASLTKSVPVTTAQPVQAAPGSIPRIIAKRQDKYKIAVVGFLSEQFQVQCQKAQAVDSLKDLFEFELYDQEKHKRMHLGTSTDFVIELTGKMSHSTEAEVLKQMGGAARVQRCDTTNKFIQALMNIKSIIAGQEMRNGH